MYNLIGHTILLGGYNYYVLTLNTYNNMDLLCNCVLFWKLPTLTDNEFEVWLGLGVWEG